MLRQARLCVKARRKDLDENYDLDDSLPNLIFREIKRRFFQRCHDMARLSDPLGTHGVVLWRYGTLFQTKTTANPEAHVC